MHESDFLEQIAAQPRQDEPRLLYADWLEQRGESTRAEFIRLQCRISRSHDTNERLKQLREREEKLRDAYQADWLGEQSSLLERFSVTWNRGMPEQWRARWQNIRHRDFELLSGVGGMRSLDLQDTDTTNPKLWHLRSIASLQNLTLSRTRISSEGLRAIPMFPRLRALILCFTQVGDAGLERLHAARRLRLVWLKGTPTTEAGLNALRAAIPGVRVLRGVWAG
jgi:uncharacterized protein (TIGR02996 family)